MTFTKNPLPTLALFCLAVLFAFGTFGQPELHASQPTNDVRIKSGEKALIEAFVGGNLNGLGRSHVLSVDGTAAETVTTDVSSDGVFAINFANSGSHAVFATMSASSTSPSTPTTYNANVIIPSGATLDYRPKLPVVKMKLYAPTGTTTLYLGY